MSEGSASADRNRVGGWLNGLAGVVIFSGSLPATRLAVMDFPPLFLTSVRAVVAAVLGAALLLALSAARPRRGDLIPLAIVAATVVVGFPLLTALALERVAAAHSVVFIGLLPLATALFGVLRGDERPQPAFWAFAALGASIVSGFALLQPGHGLSAGDVYMLAAILVCGLGYAEGALLSRRLGGWQVISWALLLALPVMAALALLTWPPRLSAASPLAWGGLTYVSVFSMLIGFVFWYRGLALGGIAGVGQLQLLQPFLGLMLAALLLGEHVSLVMVGATVAVVLCVMGAQRFAASPSATSMSCKRQASAVRQYEKQGDVGGHD